MSNTTILNHNSQSVIYLCERDKRLAKVISMVGEITYAPYEDEPYAFLIHEIIEQMLSIKAGAKIYSRLEDLCNGIIDPQSIAALSDEQIKSIGTASSKVQYIRGITEAVLNDNLNFSELYNLPDNEVYKKLTSLKGIGSWTAKMYLIFVLNRDDILPFEDVAFQQSYMWMYNTKDCSKDSIIKKCAKWKPYSSIASRYLYKALDNGFTKTPFYLHKS